MILKKQVVTIGFLILLIIIGLMGCIEQDSEKKLQEIGDRLIGKWFEEGKDNQFIHFFENGILKDNEQNGTWQLTESVLTMNIPASEDNDYLYAINFNYKFSNDYTRLTLNLVEKPHIKFYYTKEDVSVEPD